MSGVIKWCGNQAGRVWNSCYKGLGLKNVTQDCVGQAVVNGAIGFGLSCFYKPDFSGVLPYAAAGAVIAGAAGVLYLNQTLRKAASIWCQNHVDQIVSAAGGVVIGGCGYGIAAGLYSRSVAVGISKGVNAAVVALGVGLRSLPFYSDLRLREEIIKTRLELKHSQAEAKGYKKYLDEASKKDENTAAVNACLADKCAVFKVERDKFKVERDKLMRQLAALTGGASWPTAGAQSEARVSLTGSHQLGAPLATGSKWPIAAPSAAAATALRPPSRQEKQAAEQKLLAGSVLSQSSLLPQQLAFAMQLGQLIPSQLESGDEILFAPQSRSFYVYDQQNEQLLQII